VEIRFEHPAWLWSALAAVPCVVIALRWLHAMSGPRRWTAIFVRLALIALIALTLARPTNIQRTKRLAVVAVVDVSESVRRLTAPPGILDRVQAALARSNTARGLEDLAGLVVFDGRAVTIATPTLGNINDRSLDVRHADGTNIADAIALAAALVPADSTGRILLFSDGNQTAGDALAAARNLSRVSATGLRRGVVIDTVPLDFEITNEVFVESVDAPPRAATESTVSVRVTLLSTSDARGTLRLYDNDRAISTNDQSLAAARAVTLKPGRNFEVITVPLGSDRIHRFRAVFEPATQLNASDSPTSSPDTLPDNNSGEAFTITPGRGRVLIADGIGDARTDGGGTILAETLRESGLDVDLISPAALPDNLLTLQDYDLVVLQNVPADAVSDRAQQALIAHTRDLGGGLLLTGGKASFGAGGWRGTALEPLLPVKLDLPEKLVAPEAAVIFVIDSSGSMGRRVMGSVRTQQEIANEAVALAIRSMDSSDLVGVITFTDDAQTVVPFVKNTDPKAAAEKVNDVTPGGGTNMLPGLEAAFKAIDRAEAKTKHVIVLSDGKSQSEAELPGFASKMSAAGIKVSTIAIGDAAELESMRLIAERGSGVYYQVIDPQTLPKVFLKAVRVVRSPLVREVPFTPVVTAAASPLTIGLPNPPRLYGITLTQARPEPTITLAMVTPEGEPLLAHWPVELGQVAAFTSDAGGPSGGWSKDWIATPIYRQFWTRLARTLSRANQTRGLTGRVENTGGQLKLSLEALAENGSTIDRLTVPATLYGPHGETIETTLSQTQPGLYEGSANPADAGSLAGMTTGNAVGTWIAVIKPSDGSKRLQPVLAGAAITSGVETRALKSDRTLMEQIAATTGGRVLSLADLTHEKIFDRAAVQPHESSTPLWRDALLWVLVALMLDLATRRIAWDRWVSKEYGVELGREAAESVRDRGTQVGATITGLRGSRNTHALAINAAESQGFTERDAELLAKAQVDRRRAARLASLRDLSPPTTPSEPPSTLPPPSLAPSASTPSGSESLSNAKLRARARFDDTSSGPPA